MPPNTYPPSLYVPLTSLKKYLFFPPLLQAFNFAFKDTIKAMLPKVDKKNILANLGVNMLSGGLAGTGSLCIVYPLG